MNSQKRILSFLLALVMILGTFSPVLAAGLDAREFHDTSINTVEIEGKNDGKKLVFNLQEKN